MNREFVLKMARAKKMELDAVRSLLPESSRGHVDVIGRELRAMLKEGAGDHQEEIFDCMKLVMECRSILCDDMPDTVEGEQGETETGSKSRKVDIS